MLNALSIAGSHSSGLTEYDQSGGSVKRMHAGMAAHGGLRSALIAQRAYRASHHTRRQARLLSGFCREYNLDEITDGLGKDFQW